MAWTMAWLGSLSVLLVQDGFVQTDRLAFLLLTQYKFPLARAVCRCKTLAETNIAPRSQTMAV